MVGTILGGGARILRTECNDTGEYVNSRWCNVLVAPFSTCECIIALAHIVVYATKQDALVVDGN